MRRIVIGALLAALFATSAHAQQSERNQSRAVHEDQSFLDLGDDDGDERGGPEYMRESDSQSALDGGMAGSSDMFGNDVLPSGIGGSE